MTKAIDKGDMAPDFELPTDGGGSFKLSTHRGHPVIIFFYPKSHISNPKSKDPLPVTPSPADTLLPESLKSRACPRSKLKFFFSA